MVSLSSVVPRDDYNVLQSGWGAERSGAVHHARVVLLRGGAAVGPRRCRTLCGECCQRKHIALFMFKHPPRRALFADNSWLSSQAIWAKFFLFFPPLSRIFLVHLESHISGKCLHFSVFTEKINICTAVWGVHFHLFSMRLLGCLSADYLKDHSLIRFLNRLHTRRCCRSVPEHNSLLRARGRKCWAINQHAGFSDIYCSWAVAHCFKLTPSVDFNTSSCGWGSEQVTISINKFF